MPIVTVRCPVVGARVTCVTDLEGETTRVICPEYDESTGTCRLKRSVSQEGMLGQLLERVSEGALDSRSTRCVLY